MTAENLFVRDARSDITDMEHVNGNAIIRMKGTARFYTWAFGEQPSIVKRAYSDSLMLMPEQSATLLARLETAHEIFDPYIGIHIPKVSEDDGMSGTYPMDIQNVRGTRWGQYGLSIYVNGNGKHLHVKYDSGRGNDERLMYDTIIPVGEFDIEAIKRGL